MRSEKDMMLYNSMSKNLEKFIPVNGNKVNMYVCGPTVYNYFHIGNGRVFVVFDLLRRYLIHKGYDVLYIQNFTDVDDKIINRAIEEGKSVCEITDKYIEEYFKDADALGVSRADMYPRVSENIQCIIDLIQKLIDNGYAYEAEGDVYYRVGAFKDYGKLSGQSIDMLESGSRIEINDDKESPFDFTLWKKHKNDEIAWDSPWGKGRPGWHIECSAMSLKYVGDTLDIHGGGKDLIFPHHENEIAQSEGATGRRFVKYWLHNGYINIDDKKMSKSKGNFFTVRDIVKEYEPEILRMFLISSHYRSPVNFSRELLEQSKVALERIYNLKGDITHYLGYEIEHLSVEKADIGDERNEYLDRFYSALDSDFNTAEAIGVLFDLVKNINTKIKEDADKEKVSELAKVFYSFISLLGIAFKEADDTLSTEVEELIAKRTKAKKDKDYQLADKIRDDLLQMGIILEDTREGVKWKKN